MITKAKKCIVPRQQFKDLEEVVKHLLDKPFKVQGVMIKLQSLDNDAAGAQDPIGQMWPEDVSHLANVPKYWLLQIISDIEPRFSPGLMKKMDAAGKGVVGKLAECAFQLEPISIIYKFVTARKGKWNSVGSHPSRSF